MKKSMWILALVPALSLAQASGATNKAAPDKGAKTAPGPGPGYGPGRGGGPGAVLDNPEAMARIEKRVRLAATLGLSEALDLDEKGAMKVRDVFAKDLERRVAVQRQLRDAMVVVRNAARGDQAAGGQVDAALTKIRDARAQLQKLDDETLQSLTAGLSPDKKAKAALFLARFHERGRKIAMMAGRGWGPGGRHGPGEGPGMMGPGMGPGRGRGMGPGYGPGGPGGPGGGGPGFGPGPGPGGASGQNGGPGMMERQAFNQYDFGPPDLEDWYAQDE